MGPAASSRANNPASPITPYLITSAMPARNSRSGRVARAVGSISTSRGWWKAPIRFLPPGWFTPVLPPIAASTIASRVVGTCTTPMPRSQVAAANPAMSPTTPPPRATISEPRSSLRSKAASWIWATVAGVFWSSPASITRALAARSAASRLARAAAP